MMSICSTRQSGWRGVSLVAITYVYFLIFAQFGFLKRLANLGIIDTHLKIVMSAMAMGGILMSLLAAKPLFGASPRVRLQIALCACAGAAILTRLPLGAAAAVAVAVLIGAGLGLLTVTLVTHLRHWLGDGNALLKVGVGTGLGYLICNFPPLFTASPRVQAVTAAALCLIGIIVATKVSTAAPIESNPASRSPISFNRILICFTALVWLDSAAFFIIQSTPALKAGTWEGTLHLWTNGVLHLSAAIASAWLLRRRGLSTVLGLAVLALAVACLLLLNPDRAVLASLFYPIGVSLYSVALVAYPSLLAPASSDAVRGLRAGLIYAVAGWFGSAMGIGMGQHLGRVPIVFVVVALILVLAPQCIALIRRNGREVTATAAILTAAFFIDRAIPSSSLITPALSKIERGRQVYISEGCINCHSQYVRPNTPDVEMWGPAESIEVLRNERPPLIGNRRQGPDLSQVGGRRSQLWLKAHFHNPQQVSYGSFMPSYSYLFSSSPSRGDDLIAYLSGLKGPGTAQHISAEQSWSSSATISAADPTEGARLFNSYCSTCHFTNGQTRLEWKDSFKRLPPDLQTGPWLRVPNSNSQQERERTITRIIKFGIPGTDMPGHEYLPDQEVSSIALWLAQNIGQPASLSAKNR